MQTTWTMIGLAHPGTTNLLVFSPADCDRGFT